MKASVVIMAAILLLSPSLTSEKQINGNVLYVGGNGEGNYTSIQAAINVAKDGDTIYVYPGYYNESIVISKSISLIGIVENGEKPVIHGIENETTVLIEASNVTLENFIVIYGRGMGVRNANNCEIENNEILYSEGNGLSVYQSFYNLIKNNSILENKNEGIHISKSSYNIITKNLVSDNVWAGIVVFWNSSYNL